MWGHSSAAHICTIPYLFSSHHLLSWYSSKSLPKSIVICGLHLVPLTSDSSPQCRPSVYKSPRWFREICVSLCTHWITTMSILCAKSQMVLLAYVHLHAFPNQLTVICCLTQLFPYTPRTCMYISSKMYCFTVTKSIRHYHKIQITASSWTSSKCHQLLYARAVDHFNTAPNCSGTRQCQNLIPLETLSSILSSSCGAHCSWDAQFFSPITSRRLLLATGWMGHCLLLQPRPTNCHCHPLHQTSGWNVLVQRANPQSTKYQLSAVLWAAIIHSLVVVQRVSQVCQQEDMVE